VDRTGLGPRLAEQSPLRRDRRPQSGCRVREDRHDAVAGRLDDSAIGLGDHRPEDDFVALDHGRHRVGIPLPQPGASLDVREQERGRLGRPDR
jgi:hypothetical protein